MLFFDELHDQYCIEYFIHDFKNEAMKWQND